MTECSASVANARRPLCFFRSSTLSTFGATTASVFLAKDTYIKNNEEEAIAALVTKNNEPVSVNENILKVPLGALAFVPNYVTEQVNTISFRGTEGEVYFKHVDSIIVTPEKSVVMETTKGDTVSWTSSGGDLSSAVVSGEGDESDDATTVKIVLSDNTSWSIPEACEKCSAEIGRAHV